MQPYVCNKQNANGFSYCDQAYSQEYTNRQIETVTSAQVSDDHDRLYVVVFKRTAVAVHHFRMTLKRASCFKSSRYPRIFLMSASVTMKWLWIFSASSVLRCFSCVRIQSRTYASTVLMFLNKKLTSKDLWIEGTVNSTGTLLTVRFSVLRSFKSILKLFVQLLLGCRNEVHNYF